MSELSDKVAGSYKHAVASAAAPQVKIVVACSIGMAFGYSAMHSAPFGVFVQPVSRDLGWSPGDMAVALTIFNMLHMVMSPIAGWCVDRWGVRKVLIPSIVLFGLTLVSFSLLSGAVWHFDLAYALLGIVGVGTSPVTYTRLIVEWFSARRGLAVGLVLAGTGLGLTFLPPLCHAMLAAWGWRIAYVGLGTLAIAGVLPFVIPWASLPSKVATGPKIPQWQEVSEAEGLTFGEAIRDRAFIVLSITFLLLGVLTGALPPQLVPVLTRRGIPPMQASFMASALGIGLIVGRLCMGYLMDRLFAPRLFAASIVVMVAGVVVLASGASGVWLMGSIFCIGLTIGGETDFLTYILSRYIGQRAFSRVFGLLNTPWAAGVSAGPLLMSFSAHFHGDASWALYALVISSTLAMLPLFALGPYPTAFGSFRRNVTNPN